MIKNNCIMGNTLTHHMRWAFIYNVIRIQRIQGIFSQNECSKFNDRYIIETSQNAYIGAGNAMKGMKILQLGLLESFGS